MFLIATTFVLLWALKCSTEVSQLKRRVEFSCVAQHRALDISQTSQRSAFP